MAEIKQVLNPNDMTPLFLMTRYVDVACVSGPWTRDPAYLEAFIAALYVLGFKARAVPQPMYTPHSYPFVVCIVNVAWMPGLRDKITVLLGSNYTAHLTPIYFWPREDRAPISLAFGMMTTTTDKDFLSWFDLTIPEEPRFNKSTRQFLAAQGLEGRGPWKKIGDRKSGVPEAFRLWYSQLSKTKKKNGGSLWSWPALLAPSGMPDPRSLPWSS